MGSAPTKPHRKDGIYFAATEPSSPEPSDDDDRPNQVRTFKFENVTKESFVISWEPPAESLITQYLLRIFPPEEVKSKTLVLIDANPLEKSTRHTFDRLNAGTRYTVGIVAIDNYEKRSCCASASESTLPEPPTDIEFPVNESSATAFRVIWQPSKGNRDYYEAEVSPTEGVTGITAHSNILDTECVFTGLVPGTKYTATVVSVANGRRSQVLEKSNITNPGHVYDLSFPGVTHNEFQLVWKPPPGNVECYTLELSNEKETEPIIISKIKQTNYKFNGLVTGRNYFCKIYTHANGRTSVRKTFEQCTIPAEVPNLAVQKVTIDEAVITWSSAPGDVEDYDLFLSPKEGVKCDPCPSQIIATTHTFKGLLPGIKYTVGIVTNSKDKTSQRVVTGFMTDPASCGAISFPKPELKSTDMGVHWIPSTGEVDSYSVLVMQDGGTGGSWKVEDITEPRYHFTNLTPGAEYTFTVTALREGRHSESKSATCSTLPCPAGTLEFPEGGTTPNEIKISWNPSAGGVDMYKIVAVGGGKNFEDYAKYDIHEYTIPNLQPGTTYDISVSAVSWGVESEPSKAKRSTGTDKISDLKVETLSKNEMRVTWRPPYAGEADYYDLMVRPTDGIDGETDPTGVKGTEYTFTRLVPGTLYDVTVIPKDNRGVSGLKLSAEGYTLPGDILNVYFPGDFLKTDSIKVIWGVEGNCTDIRVKLSNVEKDGGGEKPGAVIMEKTLSSITEYVFTGLEEGTRYSVSLQVLGSSKLAPAGGHNSVGAATVVIQETMATKKEPEAAPPEVPATPEGKQAVLPEERTTNEVKVTATPESIGDETAPNVQITPEDVGEVVVPSEEKQKPHTETAESTPVQQTPLPPEHIEKETAPEAQTTPEVAEEVVETATSPTAATTSEETSPPTQQTPDSVDKSTTDNPSPPSPKAEESSLKETPASVEVGTPAAESTPVGEPPPVAKEEQPKTEGVQVDK